ncbi:hypothetical protein MRX96_005783 [Rhipicephalus microplus]
MEARRAVTVYMSPLEANLPRDARPHELVGARATAAACLPVNRRRAVPSIIRDGWQILPKWGGPEVHYPRIYHVEELGMLSKAACTVSTIVIHCQIVSAITAHECPSGLGLERVLLRRGGNLTGLLALLAPLAALPLIAGTALPLSMAPLLAPAMSTVLGRRRRRRDLLATFIGNNVRSENTSGRATTFCLHTSQEEQQQDEVLAGYLQCSGMLAADNHCLERLACQFSADALRGPLHKDVASLVIYTLLRNQFIPERFKQRLRSAAHQARFSDCRRRFPCTQQRP